MITVAFRPIAYPLARPQHTGQCPRPEGERAPSASLFSRPFQSNHASWLQGTGHETNPDRALDGPGDCHANFSQRTFGTNAGTGKSIAHTGAGTPVIGLLLGKRPTRSPTVRMQPRRPCVDAPRVLPPQALSVAGSTAEDWLIRLMCVGFVKVVWKAMGCEERLMPGIARVQWSTCLKSG